MLVDVIMFFILFLSFLLVLGFIAWCDKRLKDD
ncbi:hypothetical protein SCAZ3_01280 [Streptococcus canis FSL Z3-227]|uniref:NADH dehydrogenase subunit 1 n=1 Tax=Streptococcus canis FSL Z3-227 TaxID=482234 RepID=A0AAV3FPW1_STRCB|nr:hypothetical protein SCAZ3_01280 [Streptococcus canis FSL Z3-227]